MIKLDVLDRLYINMSTWALRRMEKSSLEWYEEDRDAWVDALLTLRRLQDELLDRFSVKYKSGTKYKRMCVKGVDIDADALFELFHRYMGGYNDRVVRFFLFTYWNNLRKYVPNAEPQLGCVSEFLKPATVSEIANARKTFGHVKEMQYGKRVEHTHTFGDDAKVLEYRGNRFIIDDDWGAAWAKDKNGAIRSFQLEWDWWYPIDEYLDLDNF